MELTTLYQEITESLSKNTVEKIREAIIYYNYRALVGEYNREDCKLKEVLKTMIRSEVINDLYIPDTDSTRNIFIIENDDFYICVNCTKNINISYNYFKNNILIKVDADSILIDSRENLYDVKDGTTYDFLNSQYCYGSQFKFLHHIQAKIDKNNNISIDNFCYIDPKKEDTVDYKMLFKDLGISSLEMTSFLLKEDVNGKNRNEINNLLKLTRDVDLNHFLPFDKITDAFQKLEKNLILKQNIQQKNSL